MDHAEVAAHWEANAEHWTRQVRAGMDVYRDALNTPAFLAMLPPVAKLEGIDIGCGEGANTRQLARLGARMRAVDIAPTFIRHAREAEAAEPLGIAYGVGDGTALPFPDARFDFATAFMSLMDMPDQAQALREAARVLRPGGLVVLTFSNRCFPTKAIRGWLATDEDGRVAIVRAYLERAGFDRVTTGLRTARRWGRDPLYAAWARSS